MSSAAFEKVLLATGYLGENGRSAPGLTLAGEVADSKLRTILDDERVGLKADAVFSAHSAVTSIFKDAGDEQPDDAKIRFWHEAAWNIGLAPLLWIVTPTDVRLYDCYASPLVEGEDAASPPILERFVIDSAERLRALDNACGRLATETGAFWSSAIGSKITRRHRVDRELLAEISALEQRLVDLTSEDSDAPARALARDLAQRFIGRCIFTWYLLTRGLAQPFLPQTLAPNLSEMFATTESAFELFGWLRSTFNGDLFPMDDPGAEREQLTSQHLSYLRDFVEGRCLIPDRHGQAQGCATLADTLDEARRFLSLPRPEGREPVMPAPQGFPGTGIQDNLADKAKKMGIPLFDFRKGGA